MKLKKKIAAIVLALSLAISSLALGFYASATTYNNLSLDVIYTSSINGAGDMTWYTYTPEISGTYTFLSYCTGKTEAYLYTLTVNENGSKTYNGLAYAPASDPDAYTSKYRTFEYAGTTYTHTATGFKLTYHLDAGTTYYFSAGWAVTTQSNGTIRVRLTNESYDYEVLDSVTATSDASLTWYTDGEWRTDENGNAYYYYNYSKIIQNMVVTIKYKDGSTVKSKPGANTVDGHDITYSQKQDIQHWYVDAADGYTANILTVTVMGISYDYNVLINSGAMFIVTGVVTDMITGEPLPNAELVIRNQVVSKTDADGKFSFGYSPGSYQVLVRAPYAISRNITLSVDAQNTANNNHSENPIPVLVMDYVPDGCINGKDFGYIVKNGLTQKQAAFSDYAYFEASSYSNFNL